MSTPHHHDKPGTGEPGTSARRHGGGEPGMPTPAHDEADTPTPADEARTPTPADEARTPTPAGEADMSARRHGGGEPGTSADSQAGTSAGTSTGPEAVLARRYEALLRAYPKAWRTGRGEEMLGTLLDAAEPGRRTPSPREAASILVQGTKERFGLRRHRTAGAVWSEGLRIGALVLQAQSLLALLYFLYDIRLDVYLSTMVVWGVLTAALGTGAILALLAGRTVTATVLTGLWTAVPFASDGVSHLLLTALVVLVGLSVADRSPERRRISAVWLVAAPVGLLMWLGYLLVTGAYFSPGYGLFYPLALLAAITVGVVADPRLPIAVAVLTVVVILDNSVHLPAPLDTYRPADTLTWRLGPTIVVFAAIAVVLLAIGHVRARRLARI
ncbi:hypothetical protein GCM10009827_031640 [Dactylosporangium maewongense]|uniref:Integral membrane protein n=1 Tax=Dactylosporangium maewongense TaxID=634393 RepID=A0ABN2A9X2_9ACTN